MASTQLHRVLLLIATVILSIAASDAARPCKTILFISTTTTSTSFPLIENPNFENPSHLTLYFTNAHPINPNHFLSYKSNAFFTGRRSLNPPRVVEKSSRSDSIRESTLDVVSIVGALLFGVGSGALTAGIMYLVWSMFSPNNRFDFGGESDDDETEADHDDADDDVFSPKKTGYVAVPVENGGK